MLKGPNYCFFRPVEYAARSKISGPRSVIPETVASRLLHTGLLHIQVNALPDPNIIVLLVFEKANIRLCCCFLPITLLVRANVCVYICICIYYCFLFLLFLLRWTCTRGEHPLFSFVFIVQDEHPLCVFVNINNEITFCEHKMSHKPKQQCHMITIQEIRK